MLVQPIKWQGQGPPWFIPISTSVFSTDVLTVRLSAAGKLLVSFRQYQELSPIESGHNRHEKLIDYCHISIQNTRNRTAGSSVAWRHVIEFYLCILRHNIDQAVSLSCLAAPTASWGERSPPGWWMEWHLYHCVHCGERGDSIAISCLRFPVCNEHLPPSAIRACYMSTYTHSRKLIIKDIMIGSSERVSTIGVTLSDSADSIISYLMIPVQSYLYYQRYKNNR